MDDKRAALVLAGLALAGAAVKLLLAPPAGRAPGEVTLTAPVVAPAGTVTSSCVGVCEFTVAVVPLN